MDSWITTVLWRPCRRHPVPVQSWLFKFLSDVLLYTSTQGHATAGYSERTYFHEHCVATGYSLEYLFGAIDESEGYWENDIGNSMLSVSLDKDDDNLSLSLSLSLSIYIYIYIYIYKNYI